MKRTGQGRSQLNVDCGGEATKPHQIVVRVSQQLVETEPILRGVASPFRNQRIVNRQLRGRSYSVNTCGVS